MHTYQINPLDSIIAEIKDKKERLISFLEYIKENYGVLDQGNLGNELHEEHQHSLSSHEPYMYDISYPREEKGDEYHIVTHCDSIIDYALCLILEESNGDDEVHLHEVKGLVCHLSFQNFEFDDETLEYLKSIKMVERHLEDGYFASDLISSSKE